MIKKRVAFLMSPRLGDSLISMIVVNNLQQQACHIDVYGDYIFQLKSFFPASKIYSSDQFNDQTINQYDIIISQYRHDLNNYDVSHCQIFCIDDYQFFRRKINMLAIQLAACREIFHLDHPKENNGLILPDDVQSRCYSKRVMIHCTAHQLFREWPPKKFIVLANYLKKNAYDPQFIVASSERQRCQWVRDANFAMPEFDSFVQTATFIAESGWFIGNDSGIGHLASNLNVPTLTLGVRSSLLRLWRPAWSPGIVCLPNRCLISRPLKEKYWRQFLSVNKVIKAFTLLREQCND